MIVPRTKNSPSLRLPRWMNREFAYLASAVLAVPLLLGVAALWWASPWSPVALDRPADLVAAGQVAQATEAYLSLAAGPGPDARRQEAAWRAAQLTALLGEDPELALARLEAFRQDWPDSDHIADAHALAAGVYRIGLDDAERAAAAWEAAALAAPAHPDAGRWLLDAGKALARVEVAGDARTRADRLLTQAADHPDQAGQALLALGRMKLADDPAAAYDAYDQAVRALGSASAGGTLARLGMATALERLEGREAALAELDEALAEGDVLDASLIRRRQRLLGGM